MGLFALMPVLALLLASSTPLSGAGDGMAASMLPWSAMGLVNAAAAGCFLVLTLRRARRR